MRHLESSTLVSVLIGTDKASQAAVWLMTDELVWTAVTELPTWADMDTSPQGPVILRHQVGTWPRVLPSPAHAFWSQGFTQWFLFEEKQGEKQVKLCHVPPTFVAETHFRTLMEQNVMEPTVLWSSGDVHKSDIHWIWQDLDENESK